MKRNTEDSLGRVIKAERLAKKMTREKFAEVVGISSRYLMAVENENKKPAFDKVYKMVRILGIDAEAVFYPENSMKDTQVQKLSRLLLECSEHEVKAVTALVESLLYDKPQ